MATGGITIHRIYSVFKDKGREDYQEALNPASLTILSLTKANTLRDPIQWPEKGIYG
jgi:hypothetical protein